MVNKIKKRDFSFFFKKKLLEKKIYIISNYCMRELRLGNLKFFRGLCVFLN